MTAKTKTARRKAAKRELIEGHRKSSQLRARGGAFKHVETVARSLTSKSRRRTRSPAQNIIHAWSRTIIPRVGTIWRNLSGSRRALLSARTSGGSIKG